jgi:hypothetical protein
MPYLDIEFTGRMSVDIREVINADSGAVIDVEELTAEEVADRIAEGTWALIDDVETLMHKAEELDTEIGDVS